AKLGGAEEGEQEAGMVQTQEADPVARIHAQGVEAVRDPVGQPVQLRVGPALLTEDECRPPRGQRRPARQCETGPLIVRHPRLPPLDLIRVSILPERAPRSVGYGVQPPSTTSTDPV